MCVANTCNHSHRILKVSPQHLTLEELSRGEPEKLKGINIAAAKELTIVRPRRVPVETTSSSRTSVTVDEDESLATTASLPIDDDEASSLDDVGGASGGCLKVLGQTQSLARKYNSNSCAQEKHVDWDTVEFRTHNTIMGDNPAVSFGAPIAIGDELLSTDRFAIDEYEELRPERRMSAELRMPRANRFRALMDEGYSRNEILKVSLEMNRIRSRRQRMARCGPIERLQILFLHRRSVLGLTQKCP